MIDIIRTAFDRGRHLLRYRRGLRPHECERILGEAIQPFRTGSGGADVEEEDACGEKEIAAKLDPG